MKFILGFFVGLLTGVTIVLAPLIAVVVALVGSDTSNKSDDTDSPISTTKEPPLP